MPSAVRKVSSRFVSVAGGPAAAASVADMTDVVLPCLNEAAALPAWLLARLPAGYRAIVADNGSTDGSADRRPTLGARGGARAAARVSAPPCTPGSLAADPADGVVCFMDADGSFDPAAAAAGGRPGPRPATADLVLGRRRPTGARRVAGARPARQRRARLAAAPHGRLRRCTTSARCAPPAATTLLDLDLRDRRFGYPLEMLVRGGPGRLAGHRGRRRLRARAPRAPGPR